VSARSAFALMANVGEDCAGAVQFVRPDRAPALRDSKRKEVQWLTASDVEERLHALRADHAAWRAAKDTGQFSLAGAQPKTALLRDGGRWGIPAGRVPTTHIMKPPNAQLDGLPENEHLCLELARVLGLPTAASRVMRFGDELAIVIERYDRVRTPRGWVRVHQEDLCQAMGIPPSKKYQNEGGPGARAIVELLRASSSSPEEDVKAFVDALALNWLIAGSDAHARNYSILMAPHGRVRLAPLYDVASVLPYPHFDVNRVKLAMKIGDRYRLKDIGLREWRRLAAEVRVETDALIDRIDYITGAAPDLATDVANKAQSAGIDHPIVDRWRVRLSGRARLCRAHMRTPIRADRNA
jgi:serine/threonine-protein kinase HipA